MDKNGKILIVDDSKFNREILSEILNQYTVIEAKNGYEALEYMKADKNIALVLLDLVMPEMDGFEVLKYMNQNHLIDEIAVMIISINKDDQSIEKAYELGISGYITRPFSSAVVLKKVNNIISHYKRQKKLTTIINKQIYEKYKNNDMMIMVLVVIVGASLSFAYMSYNQSIKNRNKTQVELIANSAIKSLAGAIENDENSSQLIPDTGKQINVSKMECSVPYGTISNIKINRKKENLIIASLKANYHDEDYTIYAYLTQSNNQWKCVQYDTNGNRDISTDSSSSGNGSGNNGSTDNDNDNNIGLPEGSNIADTLDKRLTVMLNQYYGDFKNIYTFIDWYKDQCKYMNKTTDANYNCDWWFKNKEGSDYHIKQAYLTCMTQNNQFDKLEDDIYQKVKDQNIVFNNNTWYPDLYVNFHIFPNSNGKYFIYASPSSGASNGGVYLIYYDQSWYVTKNKSFNESDFLNVDSIKNAVSNTDQWLKIE